MLVTYRRTATQLVDNKVGSTGSWYSSTTSHSGNVMPYSSSVPHDLTDAYKVSIFSGFVESPPLVGNTTFSFLRN